MIISLHGISCPTLAFHTQSWHFLAFHAVSWHFIAFHAISWHFIPHLGISYSYRIKAFHTTSWHFIPYGISYNIIFHTTTCGISIHITYKIHMFHIISISSQTPSGLNAERHQPMLWIKPTGVWWHLRRLLINEMVVSIYQFWNCWHKSLSCHDQLNIGLSKLGHL